MTDIPMALEPCGGALSSLAADPVPHPDLIGQITDLQIATLTDIEPIEEYL